MLQRLYAFVASKLQFDFSKNGKTKVLRKLGERDRFRTSPVRSPARCLRGSPRTLCHRRDHGTQRRAGKPSRVVKAFAKAKATAIWLYVFSVSKQTFPCFRFTRGKDGHHACHPSPNCRQDHCTCGFSANAWRNVSVNVFPCALYFGLKMKTDCQSSAADCTERRTWIYQIRRCLEFRCRGREQEAVDEAQQMRCEQSARTAEQCEAGF